MAKSTANGVLKGSHAWSPECVSPAVILVTNSQGRPSPTENGDCIFWSNGPHGYRDYGGVAMEYAYAIMRLQWPKSEGVNSIIGFLHEKSSWMGTEHQSLTCKLWSFSDALVDRSGIMTFLEWQKYRGVQRFPSSQAPAWFGITMVSWC